MATLHASRGGALALLVLAACTAPVVGDPNGPAPVASGYELLITDARVIGGSGGVGPRVVVTFTLTEDSMGVAIADVPALRPTFTLAGLLPDPVSQAGIPAGSPVQPLLAWTSYLLNGGATLINLPQGGPGTPPAQVLHNTKQPGSESASSANLADLGGGTFTFTFSTALPTDYDATRTMRVGAWLGAVPGTAKTAATFDWVPSGGALTQLQTVLDQNCAVCHGRLTAHGGYRTGVKLCLTCHTIQNADPDTSDPAALGSALAVVPDQRVVVAGTGATSFTARLLSSTASVTWTLSPAAPGGGTLSTPTTALTSTGGLTSTVKYTPPPPDAAVIDPVPVTLTASVTVNAPASGGYTPPPVTLAAPATLSVLQPPAGPAVLMTPVAQTLQANDLAVPVAATLSGVTGAVAWTLVPASGAGTLSAASGASVSYTPPARVAAATTVTATATAGGVSGTSTFTVLPDASSVARASNPNPLDLGRMVHRLHRGRNLPTLYLASSIAPAPALPSATALPLPFLTARNAVAPGTKFSILGYHGVELVGGEVVSRIDNAQPPRVVAEGIAFPQDLRNCAACHQGAPQQGDTVTSISRRTCQGCHPDLWFGTTPITDLVHFAHPGGPQSDDTQCAGCHVSGPGLVVPIASAHLPPVLSPHFNQPVLAVTRVANFQAGLKPTVWFTVQDRDGYLDSLAAPVPATDLDPTAPSPVPRAMARVALAASGPTSDYLDGNVPLSLVVPSTATADPATHEYGYTFTTALPASATASWGLGMEARRTGAVPLYATASGTFGWPYTGETITEYADNPVVYVDTAVGTYPSNPAATPRRTVIDRQSCQACHLDLSLHGSLRHNPAYCVLCHTPDGTDWNQRPKGPDGNVNLSTVTADGKVGTLDDLEERSIHFKVMVHRIHTGAGQGTARIEVGAPLVVYGFGGTPLFYDDVRFPNRLANCTLCHLGSTWLISAIPADAAPTTANETASIDHAATPAHGANDPKVLPITAACISCHGTADAYQHSAHYTANGLEQCAQCHARGSTGVPSVHGLPTPTETATP